MVDVVDSVSPQAPAPGAQSAAEPARIFVSYASADKYIADSVCAALEAAGIPCWIAPRDVKPGAVYADSIVRAITNSKALALVLSENSIASSHVGKEVERASSKKRPILAVRIDAAPLTPALEYFLSECQWIEAKAANKDAALAKLIDAISDPASPILTTAPAAHPTFPVEQRAWRNKIVFAVFVLLALAMASLISYKTSKSQHIETATRDSVKTLVFDKSVAVLPFSDLSEKHDQEYFADGIAEEVLDRLAKVQGLKIVGHASSFQFRGKVTAPADIAKALGVTYLVDGSVRKNPNRVRVTARLSNAATGLQLWSDTYDSNLNDAVHLQDTVAAEIARSLQVSIEEEGKNASLSKSPQAHDAYLNGLHSLDRLTRDGAEAAIANFQQALALDPEFALAAIGLAKTYAYIGAAGWAPPKIAFENARKAAQLAEKLDPKSPMPHYLLANVHIHFDWDWPAAAEELRQAFALGPRESYGIQIAASLAAATGDLDEARRLYIEGISLDPLDAGAHGDLGFEVHLRAGRYQEAEQAFRRALLIAPGWGTGQYFLGESILLQGRYDAALAEFEKETIDDGQYEGSAMALFSIKHKAESDAKLTLAIHQNGSSWPSEIARVYSYRDDKDHAFEWLDKAYAIRDEDLYFIKGDPLFRNLQSDPRYKAFLRKMNLPE